jgi:SsrA-binding protein
LTGEKVIARNRRALHDYFIQERLEAGIALVGSEVKSIRDGKVSLAEAYVENQGGELFLVQCHVAHYPFANIGNHDPLRPRKLLLHREEIRKISKKLVERGYTALALCVYLKNGKVKVEIGLAKGKKQVDRREDIKKRDQDRDAQRELAGRSQRKAPRRGD